MVALRKFCGAVSLAALAAAISAPAWAQAAPPSSSLEVVIVTAQQREENLQDVPVSAVALPEDEVAAMFSGGEDVLALATRVPGLYAESSNGRAAPRFYIRGLGNTDFDLAASQPVSVIYDDVVMENVVLKSTPLFDLDQVEVYRGPQGTLFGRNTTAGVIRFKSARPGNELGGKAAVSFGSFGTVTFDGGANLPIIDDTLLLRVSGLYQHRDDWVDNTFTPGEDDLGGFDEVATRVQLLYTPTDKLDVLLNVHTRDLEGTAALFRANIISKGSSGLNSSYDRDSVRYDAGGGNPQEYEGWGSNLHVDYDLGFATLTSITAYETTTGLSRGDIDGSAGPYTFNFAGPRVYPEVPFDSDTQDSIDDLDQTTQEIRLASNGEGPLSWTVGGYYFDGEFTVTTVGPGGFPGATTVVHSNDSWALFGQAGYAFTDKLTATAGVRYTEDNKDFGVTRKVGNFGAPSPPLAPFSRSVSDDHVSWELSALYDVTPTFSVYGRLADGFRGPTIQGRDVAFDSASAPSVAQSETILSVEAGWKSTLLADTLRLNGAVYTYEVSDMQFTAVGGAGNLVQLLNADKGKAYGLELDAEWAPIDSLVFTGGFSYTKTEIDDPALRVAPCGSGQCTPLDPIVGGFAVVDGNPFPNAPEIIADVTARYAFPLGEEGELFAFTDWAFQGDTNIFIYDATEFRTSDQFEGGLKFGYARADGEFEAAVFVRNITDEDNIKGAVDFNNNTAFVNEPRTIGVSFRVKQ